MEKQLITQVFYNIAVEIRINEDIEDDNPHHLVMWYADGSKEFDIVLITYASLEDLIIEMMSFDFKNLDLEKDLGKYI